MTNIKIFAATSADARTTRHNVCLKVQSGKITALSDRSEEGHPEQNEVVLEGGLLLPGFIDIHVHGGGGRAIMEATQEAQNAVAKHLATHGVTGFLPTTITAPWELQSEAVVLAYRAMYHEENGKHGAAILGAHLEGPYINPVKKGAQPEQFIRTPSIADLTEHLGDALNALKVVTLAPEMPGGLELTQFLAARNIIASIGHSNATYAQVCMAISAGARHVTHCYNAMRGLESREPGIVGAVMAHPELQAELIWDNIHVHPTSCKALVASKGAKGVILISDGIPGAGKEDGYSFSLGDLPVEVKNGSARLPDGTLAGSLLTLDKAFANASDYTLSERAAMTSYNAATALGLGHRKGLLVPGYDADLVLLDEAGQVKATIVKGNIVFRR